MKRLFVDISGTLTKPENVENLETSLDKNYCLNKKPNPTVVEAIKDIVSKGDIEVYTVNMLLVESKYAQEETNKWLDKYLPEVDIKHRLFPTTKNYADFIPNVISKNDCLIDDNSFNLRYFRNLGGRGIKLLNGMNHHKGCWDGSRLNAVTPYKELAKDITCIIKHNIELHAAYNDPMSKKSLNDIKKTVEKYENYQQANKTNVIDKVR